MVVRSVCLCFNLKFSLNFIFEKLTLEMTQNVCLEYIATLNLLIQVKISKKKILNEVDEVQ